MESDLDPSDLSYARGESDPPLLDLCIGAMLDRTAAAFPSRPALVARHTLERLTWAGLHESVERLARAPMAIGVQKGDRVGFWATNRTEWVLTQFTTAKIGAILVNLNIRYRAHEVEYALKQSECQTLILMHGFHDCDYVESLFSIAPQLSEGLSGSLKSRQLPHLSNVIFIGDCHVLDVRLCCGERSAEPMNDWADDIAERIKARKEDQQIKDANFVEKQRIKGLKGEALWRDVRNHVTQNCDALNAKLAQQVLTVEVGPGDLSPRRLRDSTEIHVRAEIDGGRRFLHVTFDTKTCMLAWHCEDGKSGQWEIVVNDDGSATFAWSAEVLSTPSRIASEMLTALLGF